MTAKAPNPPPTSGKPEPPPAPPSKVDAPAGVVLRITDAQLSQALVEVFKHRFAGGEDTFLSLCIDLVARMKVANRHNALYWHRFTDHHDHLTRAVDALCEVMPMCKRDDVYARLKALIAKAYEEAQACGSCEYDGNRLDEQTPEDGPCVGCDEGGSQ